MANPIRPISTPPGIAGGAELAPGEVIELNAARQSFAFPLPERPVLSFNREFSAPIIVERAVDAKTRAFLMAHDPDPFSRWEAGRAFGLSLACALARGDAAAVDPAWLDALAATAADGRLDPDFKALMLTAPGHDETASELAGAGDPVDPDRIQAALNAMSSALATRLEEPLQALYAEMTTPGPYAPDAAAAGRRSLRNQALALISRIDAGALAAAQFGAADNMTDSLAALRALVHEGAEAAPEALEAFRARWSHDPLVMDKWYVTQATSPAPGALARVIALAEAPAFPWKNPNKFRSLIGAFAANPVAFHAPDGGGYRFFADWLIRMDDVNPQTTARAAGAFETWRRYDEARRALIAAELKRIAAKPNLSKDLAEIVGRILAA